MSRLQSIPSRSSLSSSRQMNQYLTRGITIVHNYYEPLLHKYGDRINSLLESIAFIEANVELRDKDYEFISIIEVVDDLLTKLDDNEDDITDIIAAVDEVINDYNVEVRQRSQVNVVPLNLVRRLHDQ